MPDSTHLEFLAAASGLLSADPRNAMVVNIDAGGEDVAKIILDLRAELADAYEALAVLARFNANAKALLVEQVNASPFRKHLDWHRWHASHVRKARALLESFE